MNRTYEAIIALGRSIQEIDKYGWRTGAFGRSRRDTKCAAGLLTQVTLGSPGAFRGDSGDYDWSNEMRTIRLAARALYLALSDLQQTMLVTAVRRVDYENGVQPNGEPITTAQDALAAVRARLATTYQYEIVTVIANDNLIGDEASARQWFSDAIDVLAQELSRKNKANSHA